MVNRMLFLFWMTFSLCHQASVQVSLGQGFYLPEQQLLGVPFKSGRSIFQSIGENCITTEPLSIYRSDTIDFSSTKEFYDQVAKSVSGIGNLLSAFTMGATLKYLSSGISSGSTSVSGTSIHKYKLTHHSTFSMDCLHDLELSTRMLADLDALPGDIKDPFKRMSWSEYDTFLRSYGSHVLTGADYGVRLDSWIFAESSEEYSAEQFHIRACIDLANVPTQAGLLGIKFCGNYSNEEVKKARSLTMRSTLTIVGGSDASQKILIAAEDTGFSPDHLTDFFNEAQTHPGDVNHDLKPIWEVLKERYLKDRKDYYRKALNLEQYYEGMLDFGCSCKAEGSVVLRRFFLTSDDDNKPSYSCQIPPVGCQNDGDCHLGWIRCYCNGPSCIDTESKKESSGRVKETRFIRHYQKGSPYYGINKQCSFSVTGCQCKNPADTHDEKPIWPSQERLVRMNIYSSQPGITKLSIFLFSSL